MGSTLCPGACGKPSAGYRFVDWTERGTVVSSAPDDGFTNVVNRSLVANFAPAPTLSITRQPPALLLAWPTNFPGYMLQQYADLNTTDWTAAPEPITTSGTNYQVTIQPTNAFRFYRLNHP